MEKEENLQFCEKNEKAPEKNKTKKTKIALKIVAVIFAVLLIFIFTCWILYIISDKNIVRWHPDYEMADISAVLEKDNLTKEDYSFLYEQTGLTEIGIQRALNRGEAGRKRILKIQEEFFTEYKVKNSEFDPFMCTDYIDRYTTNIYLEDGDIIVSASTQLSCMRIGHAGLVTDGENNEVLQAVAYGEPSEIGFMTDFTDRVNYMVLRPKLSEEVRKSVAEYAEKNLCGIKYSAFVGSFNKKSAKKTQCAHIVWFAYAKCGYNLLKKNTTLVLPYDLANSDMVEVVQVSGFNPYTLWENLMF